MLPTTTTTCRVTLTKPFLTIPCINAVAFLRSKFCAKFQCSVIKSDHVTLTMSI